jgi:putative ABC transport system ATP-binding protein
MNEIASQPVADSDEAVIQINGLKFGWHGPDDLLLSIDHLSIQPGERVFVGGSSGSGKSTLLNLLTGVLIAQEGELWVLGKSLSEMKSSARDHFRANHIGYIFQLFNLIPYLGIIDNVILPCRFSSQRRNHVLTTGRSLHEEARRLLAHLDLDDPGLEQKPVNQLSIGQQQRVAAARALIGSPELIIADEPTSSLDSDRRIAFIDLLNKEVEEQGSTLVFVSHDRDLQEHFDHIIDISAFHPEHG